MAPSLHQHYCVATASLQSLCHHYPRDPTTSTDSQIMDSLPTTLAYLGLMNMLYTWVALAATFRALYHYEWIPSTLGPSPPRGRRPWGRLVGFTRHIPQLTDHSLYLPLARAPRHQPSSCTTPLASSLTTRSVRRLRSSQPPPPPLPPPPPPPPLPPPPPRRADMPLALLQPMLSRARTS